MKWFFLIALFLLQACTQEPMDSETVPSVPNDMVTEEFEPQIYDPNATGDTVNYRDKNGLRQGIWLDWYDSGLYEIKNEREYRNDTLNGIYIDYHDNGRYKITGEYAMGQAVGTWTFYDENGTLDSTYTLN